MAKRHKHKFRASSMSGKSADFICKCGAKAEYVFNKTESKAVMKTWTQKDKETDVHKTWHAFAKRFFGKDGKFKYQGWKLMDKVEKWCEKHPDDTSVVPCDDNSFMGSSIVLIEHRCETKFMGTTLITISQNCDPPAVMFLYPYHAACLVDSLKNVKAHRKQCEKRHRELKPETIFDWLTKKFAHKVRTDAQGSLPEK